MQSGQTNEWNWSMTSHIQKSEAFCEEGTWYIISNLNTHHILRNRFINFVRFGLHTSRLFLKEQMYTLGLSWTMLFSVDCEGLLFLCVWRCGLTIMNLTVHIQPLFCRGVDMSSRAENIAVHLISASFCLNFELYHFKWLKPKL